MYRRIECCRICASAEFETIVALGEQALTGVFPKTTHEPVVKGPLTLVRCSKCGLAQLLHSYDLGDLYGANYGYRSGLNDSMVEHLKQKVRGLTALVPLCPGDTVVDIGSNDGTLLGFYSPEIVRVGFDPSGEKFRKYYQPGIKLITDFFSKDTLRKAFATTRKANVVTSIAMFYDLDEPLKFVKEIEGLLAEDGVWHFEQSYLPAMLEANAYDTICHEHLEYYALKQIKWMTDAAGLKIIDIELNDVNGGSFAITVAKAASSYPEAKDPIRNLLEAEMALGLDRAEGYNAFKAFVMDHKKELPDLLVRLKRKGKKVIGYGASTKGNVILQHCGITKELIPCMAEVNPDKFGSVTPGTHIPIISETEAHAMKPDYFLVFPWHFRANIVAREKEFLGRAGKLIFPLPGIEIVGS